MSNLNEEKDKLKKRKKKKKKRNRGELTPDGLIAHLNVNLDR